MLQRLHWPSTSRLHLLHWLPSELLQLQFHPPPSDWLQLHPLLQPSEWLQLQFFHQLQLSDLPQFQSSLQLFHLSTTIMLQLHSDWLQLLLQLLLPMSSMPSQPLPQSLLHQLLS